MTTVTPPTGPTILGIDVIMVATGLSAVATFAVLLAIYAATTARDPMIKRVKALNERREQLKSPFQGRDQLDQVSRDHAARVRMEGQRPHRQPGRNRLLHHPAVPEMHPVECPDRDRDAHASNASACSARITRSSSASSTLNGPISSRRNVTQ